MLSTLGSRGWIYREGKNRRFWILETTTPFLREGFKSPMPTDSSQVIAYARGYFDADGGMPREPSARLYFQYVQKDRSDLAALRDDLMAEGIQCGVLHNPSRKVDPNYWRFFVKAESHQEFMCRVGSWHPAKERLIADRLSPSSQALESPHLSLRSR
jgi:hypothetical protein